MNIISRHLRERITGAQLGKAAVVGFIVGTLTFLLVSLLSGAANNPARQSLILFACIAAGIALAIAAIVVRDRWHGFGPFREGDGMGV